MHVLLISTYEMGRQPFGLASPAAWLAAERSPGGVRRPVRGVIAGRRRESLAALIALYLPMHTATRLAVRAIEKIRAAQSDRAPLLLRTVRAAERIVSAQARCGNHLGRRVRARPGRAGGPSCAVPADPSEPLVSLDRLQFLPPVRSPAARRSKNMPICESTEWRSVPVTPKPAAAASICAAIAPWCRSTRARFGSSSPRWCSKTSGGRLRRAPSTSRSAIRIFSTAPRTRCASWKRCIANFRALPTTRPSRSSTCESIAIWFRA